MPVCTPFASSTETNQILRGVSMACPVIVPRESEEMELCQVIHWHVKKGERVKQGDMLCEVDTGKATFDIEAPAAGVVLDIFFHENEEAPLLTPLAVIGEEGEEYEQFRPKTEEVKGPGHGERSIEHVGEAQPEQTFEGESGAKEKVFHPRQTGQREFHGRTYEGRKPDGRRSEVRRSKGGKPEGRQPVSPRARRFALRNGIPLQRVEGSGPGGAVVERDVRGWMQRLNQ